MTLWDDNAMAPTGYRQGRSSELSPRQREVLALIARGMTNFEIAERLGISLDGAKFHVREIFARLGVDSREEAARVWRQERKFGARVRRFGGLLVGPRPLLIGGLGLAALALSAISVALVALRGNDDGPLAPSPTASPPQTVPSGSATAEPSQDFSPPLAWTFEAGEGLNTFVAVDGDTVVVSATDEYADIDGPSTGLVVALDLATGDELWRHEVDAGTLIPGAGHGIAAVSDLDGVVHAWDIESGEALWTADTGAAVTQAVVAGDLVVLAQAHLEGFGADGIDSRQQITGALLALDAATGEVAWTVERDTPAWESIAIRDDVIYSVLSTPGGGDATVAAIDLNSGTETWSSAIAGGFPGPPAVDDEHVYISAGSLFALDRTDGAAAWQFEPGGTTVWPTVAGDFVVVGGNVGSWFVVDATNGELRSEQEYCDCPWIAAGNRDVVYVSGPGFFAVRIETDGSVTYLWDWEPRQGNPGVPVLLDGRVVVGTRNAGQVAAFEP